MVTKDNLASIMDAITWEQVNSAFNVNLSDYVSLNTDGYGNVYLKGFSYNDEEEEEGIISTGGIITDKDAFLQLFIESGSKNKFLLEYIN